MQVNNILDEVSFVTCHRSSPRPAHYSLDSSIIDILESRMGGITTIPLDPDFWHRSAQQYLTNKKAGGSSGYLSNKQISSVPGPMLLVEFTEINNRPLNTLILEHYFSPYVTEPLLRLGFSEQLVYFLMNCFSFEKHNPFPSNVLSIQ